MLVAAMFPIHGLKFIQVASVPAAKRQFTKNNNGIPPAWVERVPSYAILDAEQLKRIGWRGTKEQFRAELDPIGQIEI